VRCGHENHEIRRCAGSITRAAVSRVLVSSWPGVRTVGADADAANPCRTGALSLLCDRRIFLRLEHRTG
jgi:hypothetical protein